MRIYDFYEVCTTCRGRGSGCRGWGVNKQGVTSGNTLIDRPQTFCPRANTITLKDEIKGTGYISEL